ncbi:MAG: magnesium transporter [Alphaproteobacteria bacterium]
MENLHTAMDGNENILQGVSSDLIEAVRKSIKASNKKKLKALVKDLAAADLSIIIQDLSNQEREDFLTLVDSSFNFDVVLELSDHVRHEVIKKIGIQQLAKRLPELDSDDAFFLIDELTEEQQEEILATIPAAARASYEKVSSYPEHSAARLMQQELVAVPSFWKVGDAMKHVQTSSSIPYEFYEIYVVNPKHKVLGRVQLSKIIRYPSSTPIKDIMEREVKPIPATMDQEEVAYVFRKYHLVSAPVEDDSGRVIGMITSDDVVDVIEEEAEKDILQLAGVSETDFTAPFLVTSSRRIGWLVVSLVNALLAAFVIDHYKATIENKGSLAALMTIVAAMGSAAGTQVVAVTVRAYAARVFNSIDPWKTLWKETAIGMANSVFFSVILSLIVLFWFEDMKMALILPAALIFNMCWASAGGVLFPILISRLGLDPAVSAGPLLGATSDVLAFASFLGLASLFL